MYTARKGALRMGGALLFLFLCSWDVRAEEAAKSFAVRGVRLFDGQRVTPATTVLVREGRITAVGESLPVPEGTEIIEGAGRTLLPGLIDAHAHVIFRDSLKQAAVFGVTTVLDKFMDQSEAASIRADQAAGRAGGQAELRSAGTLVTAPGGHGTEYGLKIPTIGAPAEARAFVDARIAEGSDFIKIVYDDGSPYGLSFPTLTRETLAAVIAAARERGKLAVVHIGDLQDAKDSLASGANGLVHLFDDRPPDEEVVRLAVRAKVFVVPTLTVLGSVSGRRAARPIEEDPRLSPYLSPTDVSGLKRTFPFRPGSTLGSGAAQEAVRRFRDASVPILAGTDAPNPGTAHGATLHDELERLVEAGLSPVEALAAATSAPAGAFGLVDRGRIAPGLRADLVLVAGEPDSSITATRDIVAVWVAGERIDREGYRAALERQKEEAERQARAPAPPGSESGLVSDFDSGQTTSTFGSGWQVSTDSIMGGRSRAEVKVASGGAHGSQGALHVAGEIAGGVPYAWAGAMFFPGSAPMAPANLSSRRQVRFWARGDGATYRIMLFSQSAGPMPSSRTFVAEADWKEHTYSLSQFGGMDGHDLTGVLFTGGPAPGSFSFQIDDVRIE